MKILIIGSGGREHALAWKINQSKIENQIFVAPGNAGTASLFTNVQLNILDFYAIANFIHKNNIELLVVGPEEPLVNGIVDFFKSRIEFEKLLIIGPDKYGAMLEGSKNFAKEFMKKNNIPTAQHFSATKENIEQAKSFLQKLKPPYVLKADGLAAGKGVLILNTITEAYNELYNILDGKFGNAGSKVVIEEYLNGIECSVFVLTDGESYKIFPEAKDYKRIGENNTGLNTGGMGAVSPIPFFDDILKEKIENKIIKPTIRGIKTEKMYYKGFIFLGLMIVENEPYVIEYNVRMGDPETEVVIPRIESDFLELLIATAEKKLNNIDIRFNNKAVSTIMLVSGGYPEVYEKNKEICFDGNFPESIIFHAGTILNNNKVYTSGGRVLAVSSYGNNIFDATEKSYKAIKNISFEKMYYRKDISQDLKEK